MAAVSVNAQIEGDEASYIAATPTVRLGNYTQILTKPVLVSGTNQAVNSAGRKNELGYQLSLKSLEIKRDLESALCSAANGAAGAVSNATTSATHAGGAGAARLLRGLEGWIATNTDLGATGVAPVYTMGAWAAPTDGTARAFTEAQLKSVLQKIYTEGGEPSMILMGSAQKQTFSGFNPANTTRFVEAKTERMNAAIEFYVSDFGTLEAVPNRFQRSKVAFVIQPDKWALATLRPFETVELAKTGDADKKMIITEVTLEARQEKSSGAVRDLL